MTERERKVQEDNTPIHSAVIEGESVHPGSRVRLRPRNGGDILDLALAGKIATIESIAQDYEGNLHFVVMIAEDPGRDICMIEQPGHRFVFDPIEVEIWEHEVWECEGGLLL